MKLLTIQSFVLINKKKSLAKNMPKNLIFYPHDCVEPLKTVGKKIRLLSKYLIESAKRRIINTRRLRTVLLTKELARQVFGRYSYECSYLAQMIQHFLKFIFVRIF